jgi:predicted ATPase
MDEMIETTVEKVVNSLSGWSLKEQAQLCAEISERLRAVALAIGLVEHGFKIKEEDENIC